MALFSCLLEMHYSEAGVTPRDQSVAKHVITICSSRSRDEIQWAPRAGCIPAFKVLERSTRVVSASVSAIARGIECRSDFAPK